MATESDGASSGRRTRLLILLVDDEPRLLRAFARHLSRHYVATARGMPDAIALLASGFVPDVVLADYALREGTGLDVLAVVRNLLPDAHRFLITADPERVPSWAAHVADDVFDKLSPRMAELLRGLG